MAVSNMILHLGAEYNASRKAGIIYTMDEMVRLFLEGRWSDNPLYFQRVVAQAAFALSAVGSTASIADSFRFDDVSQSKTANGKLSAKTAYRKDVEASVDFHVDLTNRLRPDVVLVCGKGACEAYAGIVLPHLRHPPAVIVRLRNPSSQAHRGVRKMWIDAYKKAAVDYAGSLVCHLGSPEPVSYELITTNADVPFELRRQKM